MWRGRGRRWRGRGSPPWTYTPIPPTVEALIAKVTMASIEPRRSIVEALAKQGKLSTNELMNMLEGKGLTIPRTTLYYHLSELEAAGLIKHAGYRESGGGAPEKLWELRTRRICIDIISGSLSEEA